MENDWRDNERRRGKVRRVKKELARILDILFSDWREDVDYEVLKAAADWHTLKIKEYEEANK